MPRKPKARNTLSAGERAALYEAEQLEKQRRMKADDVKPSGRFNEADVSAGNGIKVDGIPDSDAIGSEREPRRAVRSLPKPQVGVVRVDFSVKMGEIKPMHGMCNGPVSYGADISGLFREAGVPFVRFDATDTAISAYAVDVSRIFKDLEADPSDPESYDFSATDKYVEAAILCGARVIYRLGESRDLFEKGRELRKMDPDLLSRVCVNIIRHYNDRWAGGYSFGIDHFELWNVGFELSEGDFEIYRRLANAVKLYDESIKVGGMSFPSFGDDAKSFLRACKRSRTPLDFVTADCFVGDLEKLAEEVSAYVLLMRRLGFEDCELIVGKWSYVERDALEGLDFTRVISGGGDRMNSAKRRIFEAQRDVRGAAFAAAFMLEMSRIDGVSLCCFYDAQPMLSPFCAIADGFGDPRKPYYAFKTFGELYRARNAAFCDVDVPEGFSHPGIFACAATDNGGKCYVMISSFGGVGSVDLRLDGIPEDLYTAEVYMLDGIKNMELCDSVPLSGMKKRLVLNVSEYGVIFIKLY